MDRKGKEGQEHTLILHGLVQLVQRLVPLLLLVHRLIRKRDRDDHAREVQQVNRARVPVVPELVVADGRRGGDGRDDGVELLAQLVLELTPLVEVLALVAPLLELDVPECVHVDLLDIRVQEVFDVGDDGFAGGVDVAEDVLVFVSMVFLSTPGG